MALLPARSHLAVVMNWGDNVIRRMTSLDDQKRPKKAEICHLAMHPEMILMLMRRLLMKETIRTILLMVVLKR